MEELKKVASDIILSYECECPNCGETIYPEYKDDWGIYAMAYCDQTIKCNECGNIFIVHIKI